MRSDSSSSSRLSRALPYAPLSPTTPSDWFTSFVPGGSYPNGTWYSDPCDANNRTLCSTRYHNQEQSPAYPSGDGDCDAPTCDCGKVPCGFYFFNHSSTTVVNGQTFLDWFIHDYMFNSVGASPLVSVFFWDGSFFPGCRW
jgi:hypothetical protein